MRAVVRFERLKSWQQHLDIPWVTGVDQVKVKCRERSALQHCGHSANHNEPYPMFSQDAQDFEKVRLRVGSHATSRWTGYCAEGPGDVRLGSAIASNE